MEPHEVYALRTGGGLVQLRPVKESDREALLALHARASDESIYYRFFSVGRHAADVRPWWHLSAATWSEWPATSR